MELALPALCTGQAKQGGQPHGAIRPKGSGQRKALSFFAAQHGPCKLLLQHRVGYQPVGVLLAVPLLMVLTVEDKGQRRFRTESGPAARPFQCADGQGAVQPQHSTFRRQSAQKKFAPVVAVEPHLIQPPVIGWPFCIYMYPWSVLP